MASEPIECQVLVLRVSIHCEGCKKKVKKVLQHVDGVYKCDIDARSNKVAVTASRRVDANILVAKLRKSGKQAEPWPEEPKQQQQPAESQSQETKNQNDEPSKPNEPAQKPGPNNAEASAAEPSNPQPSPEPKKSADEAPKPVQESREASNAKANADANAHGNTSAETKAATGQQSNETKGKAKQHQEEKPIDAKVTVEYDRGSYVNHMPTPQPVHVMNYNVARPMTSAAYYTAAPTPTPMPMPMARPEPSQGYIDEYAPSYYNRPSPYEPYYYPQPSPYRYQHSSTDDYYYGAPQRSAFSPPRDTYGDMFNDENANSCSMM